ncbi:twin-arginine translocation signal domain-containing protein [Haloquadratum walsbyi]|uniref:LacC domain protein n=1 Tax=Haloquadratum walsbyi (strain DSM 16790 / HBSQ001) TaxID=362976 RepID=Q18F01_HALWD|nr:twin-arginine translocation signal domain-containing protein [Haloquadratum walsbyi]CAJ53463.1 LacC domain protein [Haloquadratum walsbyi DSM 16790]
MELTRRDVIAALTAAGISVGAGAMSIELTDFGGSSGKSASNTVSPVTNQGSTATEGLSEAVIDLLDAVAAVIYPSTVENRREFVARYTQARTANRPAYREGMVDAAVELDAVARDWYDTPYAAVSSSTADTLLDNLGVDTADPIDDGTISEQIRFYLIDDLLYALYTTPTGGSLVGIENPIGHPGGIKSYQRPGINTDSNQQSNE